MMNSGQTVDELIIALVQMGFELEDCQLAIKNGKLTADEIVDWITAGKPNVEAKQPVLHLGQTASVASNSGGQLPVKSSIPPNNASSFGLERPATSEDDVPLVSRVNRNEEQRQFKLKYEEKQRQEAKKQAQLEKLAKKKAREDALRRIQEDRENLKARTAPFVSQPSPDGASSAAEAVPTHQSKPLKDYNSSILQIRLIDGKCLKQSFSTETLLQEVKDFVKKNYCNGEEISLIQPFPWIDFKEVDMERNLKDLGFVPNGSLVVKKSEAVAAQSSEGSDAGSSSEPSKKKKPSGIPPSPFDVPPPTTAPPSQHKSHDWGTGQKLVNEELEQAPMPEVEQPLDSDSEGMDEDLPPQPPPQFNQQPNLHPQNPVFPGLPFGGGGLGGPVQHDWGFGNVLAGEVLENVALPHHTKNPRALAAEAASQRFVSHPQASPALSDTNVALPQPEVPALRDILLKFVALQLSNVRSPINGLHGIPENLASMVLRTLIKERLLKPASLQMFISCRMQKIVLDSYAYCTNELLRAIRHHTYLKHLSLKSCPLVTKDGLEPLTGLKFLKVLNLSGCVKIADSSIPVLSAMKSLVVLILEDTSVTDAGVASYAAAAPPNLSVLDLSRTRVTEAIFPQLSHMPSLNNLSLEQTEIRSLSGIEGLKQLVKLNISNTQIVTESMFCLASLTSLASLNCTNTQNVNSDIAVSYLARLPLREFNLPNRLTTTDVAMSHITGMRLTELNLSNFIYITDESMLYVGQLKQLKRLLLSNTKITDAGIKLLEGLVELEELDLDRTAVTNALASSIRVFARLRELILSNTGITNGFLLTGALNQCTELTRLNLSRNLISEKGIVCLQLPFLTVLKIDNTHVHPDSLEQVKNGCPLLMKFTYKTLLPPPRDTSELD